MARTADVVIVGGGVIGAACAYFLSREGVRVHLVERQYFSSGASRASHGGLALIHSTAVELRLAARSLQLWSEIAAEARVVTEYEVPGQVTLTDTPDELPLIEHQVAMLRAEGIQCDPLDAQQIRELEPCLAPDVPGGSYIPSEAMVQSIYAAAAMADGARRRGAVLETGSAVERIEQGSGGRIARVITSQGAIDTPNVVLAGGVWTPALAAPLGVRVPVIPRKGHVIITEILPERIYRHKLQEVGYHKTLESSFENTVVDHRQFGVAFASEQKMAGNILIGTCREFVGFDMSTQATIGAAVAKRAARFVPALANVRVLRIWTGLRPHTPDHLPILGPVPGVEGLYLATGHEGLGTTMAPITGLLISQSILGQPPALPLEPLSLTRFDAAPLPDHFQEALAASV